MVAVNKITIENEIPGNPQNEWDLQNFGDENIVGFATDISVDRGGTISFKIQTDSTDYRIDIYRLGYYAGDGARLVHTIQRQIASPQIQPSPSVNTTLGLVDCGAWQVSASWAVPSAAVSGVYIAKLVRQDATAGANHIPFVVRDDGATSDLIFQTSDTTWQAYNSWGDYSLYGGATAVNRAVKVSYNRPYNTRAGAMQAGPWDWIFGVEHAMIRWLERNGYDVSYTTGVDVDRRGGELLTRKIYLSVGHDEYWSAAQRANVEAARAAGVNLAFFSGNECYWKVRWENSTDPSATPYRTLVCYKESRENAKTDPTSTWTGTWRDPRFSPPSDGGRPENGLTGTIFQVDSYRLDAIQVPYERSRFRFWRNTSLASLTSGQTGSLVTNYLGYEWDEDVDNGFRPAGLIDLSLTSLTVSTYLRDYGSTLGAALATHSLTLYRGSGGGLVFGAGTVYLPWGLDSEHDAEATPVDPDVQQATVNLFADMGVQPATLQSGLIAATASADLTPPVSTITFPAPGASFVEGERVTITGTATDVGGVVAGVEVSTDGGATWRKATGLASWSFVWIAQSTGSHVIRSRAVDDSVNLESPKPGVSVTVTAATTKSLWGYGDQPTTVFTQDVNAVELGLRFMSSQDGAVTGVRFYKGEKNVGPHTASLWTATGSSLATAAFSGETFSGWQTATFGTPVSITAGVVYVASYHTNGFYSSDENYFTSARVRAPLTALADSDGGNGVYHYGTSSVFPDTPAAGTNYWVDVIFTPSPPPPPPAGQTLFAVSDAPAAITVSDASAVELGVRFQAGVAGSIAAIRFYKGPNNVGAHEGRLWTIGGGLLATASFSGETASGWQTANFTTPVTIAANTPYIASYHSNGFYSVTENGFATAKVSGDLTAPADAAGAPNGVYAYGPSGSFPSSTFNKSNYFVDVVFNAGSTPPPSGQSLFTAADAPATLTVSDAQSVELGVKFQSSAAGTITGVRFYKGPQNVGAHEAHLWSAAGVLLATATFVNETTTGWQEILFATPVTITAGATYVASYHTSGFYSVDANYFASAHVSGALTAPSSSASGGNGVYLYGAAAAFPNQSFNASNYWVDVIFEASTS